MAQFPTLTGAAPKIIAHRGASGYLPEHTLEAYTLAIDMGADFIEPDLVFTKDGHLVVRHDAYLGDSTNVSAIPGFKDRKRHHKVFGREDWFVEDFTLTEIKNLKARQAFPGRSKDYDDKFLIPTFEEALKLVHDKAKEKGRVIGVYPETKKPGHFKKLGHDFVPPLLKLLKEYGFGTPEAPAYIQSFEPRILMRLSKMTDIPLIFLLEDNFKLAFLMKLIAHYVQGIGPDKTLLAQGGTSTGLLEKAHKAGLEVHPYTFRADQIGKGFKDFEAELKFYMKLGVDAFFTDFTDLAVSVRKNLA